MVFDLNTQKHSNNCDDASCFILLALCRYPGLHPSDVARTTHAERRSDGSVSGRNGAFYAQLQLWYWHGLSAGGVRAFYCDGEFLY